MSSTDIRETWEIARDALRSPAYRRDAALTSPAAVLDLLLLLEAERQVGEADELRVAFADHLAETGAGGPLSAPDARRWKMLRALASKKLSLPAELRADLAGSWLTDDPDAARPAAALLRARDPADADRVAAALREHAPELGAPIFDALAPPPAPPRLVPFLQSAKQTAIVALGGAMALGVASQLRIPGRHDLPETLSVNAQKPLPAAVGEVTSKRSGRRRSQPTQVQQQNAAPPAGKTLDDARARLFQELATIITQSLDAGDCAHAQKAASSLRRDFEGVEPSGREPLRESMSVADLADSTCGRD